MGKIFEYFGFIFFFYSNEHEPIHVHVKHGSQQSIYDIIIENGELVKLERREKPGEEPLDSKSSETAVEFINAYWKEIVEKWITFFVYKMQVNNTKINKRL